MYDKFSCYQLKTFEFMQITAATISGAFPYLTMLNISDVTASDLGEYTCTGSNAIGVSSIGVDLTVKSMYHLISYFLHKSCCSVI